MGKMVKADDKITAGLLNVVAGLHGGNIESAFASFNSINTNADNKSSEEKKEDSIPAEDTKEVKAEKVPSEESFVEKVPSENGSNKSSEEKKEDSITAEDTKEVPIEEKGKGSCSDETSERVKDDSIERKNTENPYAFENIICKANENKETKAFWLRSETLEMLDAISKGSNISIAKATIVHNLVATFLKENLPTLKSNYAKKCKESKKKDYLK